MAVYSDNSMYYIIICNKLDFENSETLSNNQYTSYTQFEKDAFDIIERYNLVESDHSGHVKIYVDGLCKQLYFCDDDNIEMILFSCQCPQPMQQKYQIIFDSDYDRIIYGEK